MTTYWVRPATDRDRPAVDDLKRRARRELQLATRAPASAGGADRLWVVEAGRREIVGCCGLRELTNGVWELEPLFLAPEWRGFGLGRALVEQAVRTARNEGAIALVFTPPPGRADVQELARRLGFEEHFEQGRTRFRRELGAVS